MKLIKVIRYFRKKENGNYNFLKEQINYFFKMCNGLNVKKLLICFILTCQIFVNLINTSMIVQENYNDFQNKTTNYFDFTNLICLCENKQYLLNENQCNLNTIENTNEKYSKGLININDSNYISIDKESPYEFVKPNKLQTISLNDLDRKIFESFITALNKNHSKGTIRVIGGWVRDKVNFIYLLFSFWV